MDDSAEEWKPVVGFEKYYEISDEGRVKNIRTGHILCAGLAADRYPQLRLWKDGEGTAKYVHVLVAEAFIGAKPMGYEANHRDGNRLECASSNLEYLTGVCT